MQEAIGFDRAVRLGWLDATADWTAQELAAPAIRLNLDGVLDGEVAGDGPHSAKGKTKTVLLHIWVLVPPRLVPLRDAGLALLERQDQPGRLALHWGMALATYPFFRDTVSVVGRLLDLQGNVATSQVARRMEEAWGERSTISRAVPRVLRSLVDWGVLRIGDGRDQFVPGEKIALAGRRGLSAWMVEAYVHSSDVELNPLRHLHTSPRLFPFSVITSTLDLVGHPRLDVFRQGGAEEVVVLKAAKAAITS